MSRRRTLLIANRAAAGPAVALAEAVAERLKGAGAAVELLATDSEAAFADALLAAREFDVAAIAGGDGAARRAAAALLGRRPALALLPAGAANVIAGDLGIGRAPGRLADMILRGGEARIALGRANGAPFLAVAGAGLDGAAAAQVDAASKRGLLLGAYGWAAARALAGGAGGRLEAQVDGGAPIRAAWALALNARLWPGSLWSAPPGRMRLALFAPGGRSRRTAEIACLAAGRLALAPGARLIAFARATIDADAPVAIEADGEPLGATPLALQVETTPVRVLRPAGAG